MPTIRRTALVEHSAARMFALVNDIDAYPRRFDWCESAQVLEADETHVVARLDLKLGSFGTWFVTENTLSPPHHIDMKLREGPFKTLGGRWEFHALDECACKVTLTLTFEAASKLLAPAVALGLQGLADRMVDDFTSALQIVVETGVVAEAGMKIEVVLAWPRRAESVTVDLPAGASVADAVAAAGLNGISAVDGYAVFGQRAQPETVLGEGDRVELLRPLQADPKEARRKRARKGAADR